MFQAAPKTRQSVPKTPQSVSPKTPDNDADDDAAADDAAGVDEVCLGDKRMRRRRAPQGFKFGRGGNRIN